MSDDEISISDVSSGEIEVGGGGPSSVPAAPRLPAQGADTPKRTSSSGSAKGAAGSRGGRDEGRKTRKKKDKSRKREEEGVAGHSKDRSQTPRKSLSRSSSSSRCYPRVL
jgi:hypothetical protein